MAKAKAKTKATPKKSQAQETSYSREHLLEIAKEYMKLSGSKPGINNQMSDGEILAKLKERLGAFAADNMEVIDQRASDAMLDFIEEQNVLPEEEEEAESAADADDDLFDDGEEEEGELVDEEEEPEEEDEEEELEDISEEDLFMEDDEPEEEELEDEAPARPTTTKGKLAAINKGKSLKKRGKPAPLPAPSDEEELEAAGISVGHLSNTGDLVDQAKAECYREITELFRDLRKAAKGQKPYGPAPAGGDGDEDAEPAPAAGASDKPKRTKKGVNADTVAQRQITKLGTVKAMRDFCKRKEIEVDGRGKEALEEAITEYYRNRNRNGA